MRVKMLTSMPVAVDGVESLDLEEGDEYEVGDGIGENLIEHGHAEPVETKEHVVSGRRRGKKADAEPVGTKDAGAAAQNKSDADPD